MKLPQNIRPSLLLATSLFAAGNPLSAAVLVSDNFTASSGTNVATVNNTEASSVGTWSRHYNGGSSMSVGTVAGFGSGNVLSLSDGDSAFNRAFNGGFTTSLASLGINDSITLSFDLRFSGTFGTEGSRQLSFGFLGSSDSIAYVSAGVNGSDNAGFKLRSDSRLMSTNGTTIGSGFTNSFAADTNYQVLFSVTKTAESSYTLKYILNGTTVSETTSSLASTAGLDINAVAFRWSSDPGVTTYLDNIQVEIIPEPSALLLGTLAPLFLLRRKRTA